MRGPQLSPHTSARRSRAARSAEPRPLRRAALASAPAPAVPSHLPSSRLSASSFLPPFFPSQSRGPVGTVPNAALASTSSSSHERFTPTSRRQLLLLNSRRSGGMKSSSPPPPRAATLRSRRGGGGRPPRFCRPRPAGPSRSLPPEGRRSRSAASAAMSGGTREGGTFPHTDDGLWSGVPPRARRAMGRSAPLLPAPRGSPSARCGALPLRARPPRSSPRLGRAVPAKRGVPEPRGSLPRGERCCALVCLFGRKSRCNSCLRVGARLPPLLPPPRGAQAPRGCAPKCGCVGRRGSVSGAPALCLWGKKGSPSGSPGCAGTVAGVS